MSPRVQPQPSVGGTEVIIVQDGNYGDFNRPTGHIGAQPLEAGTIISYPKWYADSLVETGHAMKLEDAIIEAIEEKGDIDATDAAVKLASEHGIDLAGVEGSGKDGRITKSDITKMIQE